MVTLPGVQKLDRLDLDLIGDERFDPTPSQRDAAIALAGAVLAATGSSIAPP